MRAPKSTRNTLLRTCSFSTNDKKGRLQRVCKLIQCSISLMWRKHHKNNSFVKQIPLSNISSYSSHTHFVFHNCFWSTYCSTLWMYTLTEWYYIYTQYFPMKSITVGFYSSSASAALLILNLAPHTRLRDI